MLSLDIVICTRNRDGVVQDALADALEQRGAGHVLVVDQSDDPSPLATWAATRGVQHVVDPGRGLPRARNVALAHTQADVVLFLDDDVRLHPGCVAAHTAAYEDPAIGGVTGHIDEATVRPNAAATTNRLGRGGRVLTNLTGPGPCDLQTLKGAHMSLRRVALDAAGPCDEGMRGTFFLEDAEWSTRVRRCGWRLRYLPTASLVHLSAAAGGCRVEDALRTERWRFHNTGRFVARHRPGDVGRVRVTFAAIAARRAAGWRMPGAVATLLGAFREGVRSVASPWTMPG